MSYPQRIVCLAAEVPEIIDALGALSSVVGVSGFTRHPVARKLPKMGGFRDPNIKKILGLAPDLVITTSDIQADAAAQLIRQGVAVLALNPYRLEHIWRNILLVGGALGRQQAAEALIAQLQGELDTLRAHKGVNEGAVPRVYFEEWPDPMISGIGWVSDLIQWLGGVDIFAEVATERLARNRFVTADAVVARQPEIIIASWCGKKADLESIRTRPGWEQIPAVQRGAVYEVASSAILQTGPSILTGARQLATLIHTHAT